MAWPFLVGDMGPRVVDQAQAHSPDEAGAGAVVTHLEALRWGTVPG